MREQKEILTVESHFCWNTRTAGSIMTMMTSSNGNIFRITGHLCGEFTGPCTKASDAELWCFFYLRLIKRLSKHSRGWWFETPSRSLWRHRNYILVWWKLSISSTMDVVIFRMGPRKVKCLSITTSAKCFHSAYFPAGTRRNNNVFTMSTRRRRRRVDVVKRLSLRHYCVMCPLGLSVSSATADSWQKLFQLPLLISWHAAML